MEKNGMWKKKLLIGGISLAVVLSVFLVVLGVTGIFSGKSGETLDEEAITEEQLAPVDKASGKINVLLLGVDLEGYRTDTIIVASYDLDNGTVNMLSIPRDTRMYIGSRYQKINAAHALSQAGGIKGPQGSIEAVTRLTGIPINYYVEFNFSTFRDVIDALGGVDFDVPRDMNYEDPVQDLYIHLQKGQQHLDGDKAEQLVRFRRYPEGDIARVKMQQEFLKALAEQKLNASIIEKIPDLFKTFQENIKTNFTLIDVMKYLPNLSDLSAENISMYQVPGNYNDTDYGASYWIADMTKLKQLVSETFGYSATNATIHSADGSSVSKDTVISKSTTSPTTSNVVIKVTPKPSTASANTTESPSSSPKASKSPDTDDEDEEYGMDGDLEDEPSATKKPSKTSSPSVTSEPSKTAAPAETAAPKPTEKPAQETKAPEEQKQTASPAENKVTRPTANPSAEE
jgi:LCP family protein required for cell wall assembly